MLPQPTLKSLAGAQIWPADWSQFVPDAVLTLSTGLMIGVLLWLWQRNVETRYARRAAESGWQIARPHFVAVADPLEVNGEEYYLTLAVAGLDPLVKEGRHFPIGAWADAAPNNRELTRLRQLLIDAPTLQRLAAELSRHYEHEIVRLGDAPAHSTDLYERAATYVVLELDVPPYLQGTYVSVAERRLIADPIGYELVREFRERLLSVRLGLDALRVDFYGQGAP